MLAVEDDIKNVVKNCKKPCSYKEYKFIGERKPTGLHENGTLTFSLWSVTRTTVVETEELFYPWTSLIAEFGGALGLFLGFSFMTLWERMENFCRLAKLMKH